MSKLLCRLLVTILTITLLPVTLCASVLDTHGWERVSESSPWAARAGQQVLNIDGTFYLIAGRTPLDLPIPGASIIWGDVWSSEDLGETWTLLLADSETSGFWRNRAYFQAVEKDGYMYVIGGQNFELVDNPCPPFPTEPPCPLQVPASDFFNDVWRSADGINWEEMTDDAPWEGRAGLSAVALGNDLFVMAGSQNDDEAIGGGGPVPRIYFNDVWKSTDNGVTWVEMTGAAPWAKRAGGVALVKDGWIYMIGGEAGFVGPYFNDTWRSQDGATWESMSLNGGWSPRPGHKCAVILDRIVCFGGFGLIQNPTDMWATMNGSVWSKLLPSPWNVISPLDVKYDFDVVTYSMSEEGPDTIFTFGGDRERFDLPPEVNVNLVDNDVWMYTFGLFFGGMKSVPVPGLSALASTIMVALLTMFALIHLRRVVVQ